MKRIVTAALAATLAMCLAPPAGAHFVWLSIEPSAAGRREAHLWFSETAEPGSAELLNRLDKAHVLVGEGGTSPVEVPLENRVDGEVGEKIARLAASANLALAECDYGLFKRGERAMHLVYFAKALALTDPQQLDAYAKAADRPLEVVAHREGDQIAFAVLWQGKPAAGAEISLAYGAELEPRDLKADDQGIVRAPAGEGRYAVRAGWSDAKPGEIDGQRYDETRYYSTLTLALPKAAKPGVKETARPDDAATELLARARESRAIWEDFPGFTCRVKVHLDQELSEGELVVNADGSHELKGVAVSDMPFLEQQLGTLLSHRLPDNQLSAEGSFPPGALDEIHALGTRVALSSDVMGSAYRIQDDVITEVNRDAGPLRFTISVLHVERNAEDRYLPGTFAVDFWKRSDGQLMNSLTYHHRWKRVGTFDLPERVTICNAAKDKRQVLRIDFADHVLTTK